MLRLPHCLRNGELYMIGCMNINMPGEMIPLHGSVKITTYEMCPDYPNDKCMDIMVEQHGFDNLIVNVGKDTLLKRIGGLSCSGFTHIIGVGDSTTAAGLGDTDLIAACNKVWKIIAACCKVYVRPTLFVSSCFGYSCANFTWNELGLADCQGSPCETPACGALLISRQIDCTPLVKDCTKRAIVEWQLTL